MKSVRPLALLVAALVLVPLAMAAPATAHEGEPHDDRMFTVSLEGTGLAVIEDGNHVDDHFGGGASFGVSILHDVFDAELAVRGLVGDDVTNLVIDLTLKFPFRVDDVFIPYVGIGPAFVLAFSSHDDDDISLQDDGARTGTDVEFQPGGLLAAGATFWTGDDLGFLFELNYNLVAADELRHWLGGSFGIAYRF